MHFPQINPPGLSFRATALKGFARIRVMYWRLVAAFIAACAQIIIGSHTGAQVMSDTDRHTDRQTDRHVVRQTDR